MLKGLQAVTTHLAIAVVSFSLCGVLQALLLAYLGWSASDVGLNTSKIATFIADV